MNGVLGLYIYLLFIFFLSLRLGVSHTDFDIEEIIDSVGSKLLPTYLDIVYIISSLPGLPHSTHCPYSHRKRQHYCQLHHVEYSQYKNSSIVSMIIT